jgi:NADPH:quinone reductase-like Zn-dependent oxidoreductase
MRLMPNFVAKRPFAAAEYDLAGTVIISRSTLHAVGDRVYGWIDLPAQKTTKQGSLTEYTVVHGNLLHKRPDNMSAVDAAGIPLVAQTAWMGLFEIAKLQEGQTVFINGGSSSVGLFAIQLAKARGLTVWTSASGKNEELVRSVGADEVCLFCILAYTKAGSLIPSSLQFFDYTAMPLAQALAAHQPAPQFHAIFDAVGLYDPSLFNGMPKYTTPEAPYVTAGGPPEFTASGIAAVLRFIWAIALKPRFLGGTNRKAHFFELTYKRDRAVEVDKLVAAGECTALS